LSDPTVEELSIEKTYRKLMNTQLNVQAIGTLAQPVVIRIPSTTNRLIQLRPRTTLSPLVTLQGKRGYDVTFDWRVAKVVKGNVEACPAEPILISDSVKKNPAIYISDYKLFIDDGDDFGTLVVSLVENECNVVATLCGGVSRSSTWKQYDQNRVSLFPTPVLGKEAKLNVEIQRLPGIGK
jgi:hypothetical protein